MKRYAIPLRFKSMGEGAARPVLRTHVRRTDKRRLAFV